VTLRLVYVVQRYGLEVAGGSELACRRFATALADRGHEVHVLTSCAVSYFDWANHYAPGRSEIDGVVVHRLAVSTPRTERFFAPLNARIFGAGHRLPLHVQEEWMRRQGPLLPDLVPWLHASVASYDAAIFFTYLYYTTWRGLPAAAGATATVLHPTAHDEPPIHLPLFDPIFRLPSALVYLSEEERDFVRQRFRLTTVGEVIGLGTSTADADLAAAGERTGLGPRPYLCFLGRVDPAKGSEELFEYFLAYKQRRPGPLALAMVGEVVRPLPPHPDVVMTGFVDEATKRSLVAGARLVVQPSYFESFSMALNEAWSLGRPAVVQGACEVLAGQARRSGGAIPYRGYMEFEAAVDLLLEDPVLAGAMGEAGCRYVEERYQWDGILDRYEALLGETVRSWPGPG
jgi:glycosyltransferase involved in cell wall biosynthesis